MRVPYQTNLTILSSRITGSPGLIDKILDGSSTLRCGNPLLSGYPGDDVLSMEFLDDSHEVHLPSGIRYITSELTNSIENSLKIRT
jgi:hypothetical protein